MSVRNKFNWVQFTVGATLGALIGFSLWMSLPKTLTYSAVAGIACVLGVAIILGWFVGSRGNPFRRHP